MSADRYFDPETIRILDSVLEHSLRSLPAEAQTESAKAHLALRILELARDGERDPEVLERRAAMHVS